MPVASLLELEGHGPLLTLAVVLLAGVLSGALARRVRLPGVTGQIVAGILLGRAGLELVPVDALHELQPVTHFALGLMAVTVGAHLDLRRLRNAGRRLALLFGFEALLTPLLVIGALSLVGRTDFDVRLLLAALAVSTAPATVVALVRETRAKGVFVKTLIAAVALNNMACIVLFEVARAIAVSYDAGTLDLAAGLWGPTQQVLLAFAIGGGCALAVEAIGRIAVRRQRVATAAFLAILLSSGLADFFGVSALLACLFLGLIQTNLAQERGRLVDAVFRDFEPAILAVFFTLAGMHLSIEHAAAAGVVAPVFFAARIGGKWLAGELSMRLAGAPVALRRHIGMALAPQAGLAVGLLILVQDDPRFAHAADLFAAIVLTVVTLNEIVGPILTRYALVRAGEADMDRSRLLDFLQEENIVTGLTAETKEEAIRKLVDLFVSSHHLPASDKDAFLASVLEREAEVSTCLGSGFAIPHGELPSSKRMLGVMGISREGLPFETPDGRPVHCMVLLGTPPDERERHLEVLGGLARSIGLDGVVQARLFNTTSAAHAYDILHGAESTGFNYFLDEPDEER